MTVFLYDVKRRLDMTLRDSGGSINWNLPMDTTDFKLHKDVKNSIEFVVRNTDRKPVSMVGRTAKITLFDHRTDQIILTSDLKVVNDLKGIVQFNVTPDQMDILSLGTYSYTVMVTDLDGSVRSLYVDQNESVRGFVEVKDGPNPSPRPSIEIDFSTMTPITEGEPEQTHYITSALQGSVKTGNTSGQHTVAVYLSEFTGKLWIQGSLEEGVPDLSDWFDIDIDGVTVQQFRNESGIRTFMFEANLEWVRIKVLPDTTVSPGNENQIKKIIFRN